ncbi:MAG: SDR family oxidoreductase [Proteobacteria bacterium]|nr:SDR family oxidoreductase [Pseudomonadota bacterium]
MRLAGRRCAIIGAGQTPGETLGNGRAIALRFAAEGASLLLVDRDGAAARDTAEAVLAATPGARVAVQLADITAVDGPVSIARAAAKRLGGLDGLIHVVGIGDGRDAPAGRLDDTVWDRLIAVNLTGAFRTISACLPLLREGAAGRAGGAAIVTISSLAALAPTPMLAYSVSKAALDRLTQSVAMHEAAHQVRCNAVLPGLMDTPMAIENIARNRGIAPDVLRAERARAVPMGHMGDAMDTANAALFLTSDEARFITGVLLSVDGGQSLKVG